MLESKNKRRELLEEFRLVIGQVGLLDTILPTVLFLALDSLADFQAAIWGALIAAGLIGAIRAVRKQPLRYALGGIASVLLAIALAMFIGRSEGFFLPDIVNGGLTVALALVSLLMRKPLVAWTSYLARRWPVEWYWHDKVRPAYSEVTVLWTVFFALRLLWQISLYQGQKVNQLALVNVLTGWPAIILLLLVSYLYGSWRLTILGGPSIEEFKNKVPAPWVGQLRGF